MPKERSSSRFSSKRFLGVGENRIRQLLRLRSHERRHIERRQLAVDPNLRRGVGSDVQIRAAALDHRLEKLMKGDGHWFSSSGQLSVVSSQWSVARDLGFPDH